MIAESKYWEDWVSVLEGAMGGRLRRHFLWDTGENGEFGCFLLLLERTGRGCSGTDGGGEDASPVSLSSGLKELDNGISSTSSSEENN